MPATLTRTPAYVAATVEDLLALWHGDPDTDGDDSHHVCGYHHPSLVTAVCELTNPGDVHTVRARFYPTRTAKETPKEAVVMIVKGYQDWRARAA